MPAMQSAVDYVSSLIKGESEKTGIPAKTIFRPNRNDRSVDGIAARNSRAAVWRKMLRAGWSHDAIGEAFGCTGKNVYSCLKGHDY